MPSTPRRGVVTLDIDMSLQDCRARYPVENGQTPHGDITYIRTRGAGPPVIMLPGAQGTCEIFFKQLLTWGAERDVISITYPSIGNANALADWVTSFAKTLGLQRFDLVGSSFGGYVAQCVRLRHPANVGKSVIGNSFVDPTPSQSQAKRDAIEAKSAEDVQREALERIDAGPPGELRSVLGDLMRTQTADCLKSRFLGVQMAHAIEPDFSQGPMLLVETADDPLISPAMRQTIRNAYPHAQVLAIPHGGHYPYILASDIYTDRVGRFLAA